MYITRTEGLNPSCGQCFSKLCHTKCSTAYRAALPQHFALSAATAHPAHNRQGFYKTVPPCKMTFCRSSLCQRTYQFHFSLESGSRSDLDPCLSQAPITPGGMVQYIQFVPQAASMVYRYIIQWGCRKCHKSRNQWGARQALINVG